MLHPHHRCREWVDVQLAMWMGKRPSGRIKIIDVVSAEPCIRIDLCDRAYVIERGSQIIDDQGGGEITKVQPMPCCEHSDGGVSRVRHQVRKQHGIANPN